MLVLAGLTLVLLGNRLDATDGLFMAGRDVVAYHFWALAFFKEQVLSGSFPLWNPAMYCGHPYLANPANFVFYPSILLYLVLPIPWALNVDIATHLLVAATGAYTLGFLLTGSRAAGLSAAVVYAFSGHLLDTIHAGHLNKLHAASVLPWIFWQVERACRGDRTRHLACAGVLFGLQLLTGNSQNNVYTMVFSALYFAGRHLRSRDPSRVPLLPHAASFLLVPLMGVGLAAIQLAPSAEFVALSDRAEPSYAFSTFMSFPWANLLTLLVPRPDTPAVSLDWEYSCYASVLAIGLAALGAARSSRRAIALPVLVLCVLALTFMLGANTPLYRVYFEWVPLVRNFRIPARALVLFVLLVSMLVALGTEHLLTPGPQPRFGGLAALAALSLGGLMLLGARALGISPWSPPFQVAYGFVALSAAVLHLAPRAGPRLGGALVVAVIYVDLHATFAPGVPSVDVNELLTQLPYEKVIAEDPELFRVAIPSTFTDDLSDTASRGGVFGYQNANGYIPLAIGTYFRFVHDMASAPVPVHRRHTLAPELSMPGAALSSRILGIKYVVFPDNGRISMTRARWHMPRALLAHRVEVIPDRSRRLQRLQDPAFNPVMEVILESADERASPAGPSSDASPLETVAVSSYGPDAITLDVTAASPGWVVVSELFFPGWEVTVDGEPSPIHKANEVLRAVAVGPGHHVLEMVYRPLSLRVGAAVSAFTLIALAWSVLRARRRTSP